MRTILALFIFSSLAFSSDWLVQSHFPWNVGMNAITKKPNGDIVAVGEYGAIALSLDNGTTWKTNTLIKKSSYGLNCWFWDVCFIGDMNGWAVGQNGMIFSTNDGGISWKGNITLSSINLNSVSFSNPRNGWVAGFGDDDFHMYPELLKTTNSGNTWISIKNIPYARASLKIASTDSLTTYLMIDSYYLMKTANAGASWDTLAFMPRNSGLLGFNITTDGIGIAYGQKGVIFTTNDSGKNWIARTQDTTNTFRKAQIVDPKHFFALNQDAVLFMSNDSGKTWAQRKIAGNEAITNLCFADSLSGWIVGKKGFLAWTNDAGITWSVKSHSLVPSENWSSISCIDSSTGWACGSNGTAIQTMDGGKSWSRSNVGTQQNLVSCIFTSKQHGWAAGDSGTIFHSHDGGTSWNKQLILNGISLGKMASTDEYHGWIIAKPSQIFRTIDGGEHWDPITVTSATTLIDICFTDALHGWCSGTSGKIFHTADGGINWSAHDLDNANSIRSVFFIDQMHGWASSAWGIFYSTLDGGATWQTYSYSTNFSIASLFFIDTKRGWGVGEYGLIIATIDGGDTWYSDNWGLGTDLTDISGKERRLWAVGRNGCIISKQIENSLPTNSHYAAFLSHKRDAISDSKRTWNIKGQSWQTNLNSTTRTRTPKGMIIEKNGKKLTKKIL